MTTNDLIKEAERGLRNYVNSMIKKIKEKTGLTVSSIEIQLIDASDMTSKESIVHRVIIIFKVS